MEPSEIIQIALAIAGVAYGVLGVMGKREAQEVLGIVIEGVETAKSNKDVKSNVRRVSLIHGKDKQVHREVKRRTKKEEAK